MFETIKTLIGDVVVLDRVIADDEDLILNGVLDSISALKLVAALETAFGQKVPSTDLTYENFQSVGAMAAYLESRGS